MKAIKKSLLRLLLAVALVMTLGGAVAPALSVYAADAQEETTEVSFFDDNGEPTDTTKITVVFLMGAVLIIIIAVVVTIVSSVVSTVASAVEDEED